MKIIFIGQKGIGDVSGGIEKHVEAISTEFAKANHNVIVYARKHLFPKRGETLHGVNLVYLGTVPTKHLEAIIHTFLSILHIFLFQRNVDIIHFHSIGPSSLLWLMRVLKPRTNVVATMHAKCYEHSKWGSFAQSYLKFSEFLCCTFSKNVIVISQELKKYVKEKYKKEAKYIPNGAYKFDKKSISEEILNEFGLKKGQYLLFVGRLIPGKKVDVLIEAYKKLETDKKLVIVGDNSYTDNYAKSIRELVNDNKNIIFTGFRNSSDIASLMNNAFSFVFPSESEGMSLVLLEAMSASLPIIASDIEANKAILDENECTFFEPNNIISLENALKHALKNKEELLKKRDKAKIKFLSNFEWSHIAKLTINYYKHGLK